MAADDFFQRWSKRNAELRPALKLDAQLPAATPARQKTDALPTLDDVAALTPESDYSPFVARGIDPTVQRSAMKKLFSDPHFNLMDGLDTYIDDYNKFEPIPPEMLALLNHAQDLLNPLARLELPRIEMPPAQLAAPDKIPAEQAGQPATGSPHAREATENPPQKPEAPLRPVSDQDRAARAATASTPPPDPA